jgi:hypothetical protein
MTGIGLVWNAVSSKAREREICRSRELNRSI